MLLAAAGALAGLCGATCNGLVPPCGSAPAVVADDHVLGSADAPVTVVEYSSFQCGWCGLFARASFPTLREQYIDTGKVRWIFRHFVDMNDSVAVTAACASECAAEQGRYVEYRELLLTNQADLSVAALKQHAATLGLDQTAFDACVDGGSQVDRVRQDVDSGAQLGVNSTPRFFVDCEVVYGYKTAEQFAEIIERHLQTAGGGP